MSKKVEVEIKVTIIVQDDAEYITFDEDGEIKQHFEYPDEEHAEGCGVFWVSDGKLPVRLVPKKIKI